MNIELVATWLSSGGNGRQADFHVVANVTTPGGTVAAHRFFLLEAGWPGLRTT